MFRKTDTQRNLFGMETRMPQRLRSRLKEILLPKIFIGEKTLQRQRKPFPSRFCIPASASTKDAQLFCL